VANKLGDGKKRNSRKVVLVMDGLHVVDQNSTMSLLTALPHSFPACVRVILSTQVDTPSYDVSIMAIALLAL
jgi:hypothetical protein